MVFQKCKLQPFNGRSRKPLPIFLLKSCCCICGYSWTRKVLPPPCSWAGICYLGTFLSLNKLFLCSDRAGHWKCSFLKILLICVLHSVASKQATDTRPTRAPATPAAWVTVPSCLSPVLYHELSSPQMCLLCLHLCGCFLTPVRAWLMYGAQMADY